MHFLRFLFFLLAFLCAIFSTASAGSFNLAPEPNNLFNSISSVNANRRNLDPKEREIVKDEIPPLEQEPTENTTREAFLKTHLPVNASWYSALLNLLQDEGYDLPFLYTDEMASVITYLQEASGGYNYELLPGQEKTCLGYIKSFAIDNVGSPEETLSVIFHDRDISLAEAGGSIFVRVGSTDLPLALTQSSFTQTTLHGEAKVYEETSPPITRYWTQENRETPDKMDSWALWLAIPQAALEKKTQDKTPTNLNPLDSSSSSNPSFYGGEKETLLVQKNLRTTASSKPQATQSKEQRAQKSLKNTSSTTYKVATLIAGTVVAIVIFFVLADLHAQKQLQLLRSINEGSVEFHSSTIRGTYRFSSVDGEKLIDKFTSWGSQLASWWNR